MSNNRQVQVSELEVLVLDLLQISFQELLEVKNLLEVVKALRML